MEKTTIDLQDNEARVYETRNRISKAFKPINEILGGKYPTLLIAHRLPMSGNTFGEDTQTFTAKYEPTWQYSPTIEEKHNSYIETYFKEWIKKEQKGDIKYTLLLDRVLEMINTKQYANMVKLGVYLDYHRLENLLNKTEEISNEKPRDRECLILCTLYRDTTFVLNVLDWWSNINQYFHFNDLSEKIEFNTKIKELIKLSYDVSPYYFINLPNPELTKTFHANLAENRKNVSYLNGCLNEIYTSIRQGPEYSKQDEIKNFHDILNLHNGSQILKTDLPFIRNKNIREDLWTLPFTDNNIPSFWRVHKPTFLEKSNELSTSFNSATKAMMGVLEVDTAKTIITQSLNDYTMSTKNAKELSDIIRVACAFENSVALCCKGIYLNIIGLTNYVVEHPKCDKILQRYKYTTDILALYGYSLNNNEVSPDTKEKIKSLIIKCVDAPISLELESPDTLPIMSMETGYADNLPLWQHIDKYTSTITRAIPSDKNNPTDNGFADAIYNIYNTIYEKAKNKSAPQDVADDNYIPNSPII